MHGPVRDDVKDRWLDRLSFGTLAIAGSALYVVSFDVMRPLACAITIAAALSWIAFGGALLMVTRARPGVMAWADACLAPMAVGGIALSLGALANAASFGSTGFHAALLVVLNVTMAALFVPRARALGLKTWMAVSLWVVGLDGLFLCVVGGLMR